MLLSLWLFLVLGLNDPGICSYFASSDYLLPMNYFISEKTTGGQSFCGNSHGQSLPGPSLDDVVKAILHLSHGPRGVTACLRRHGFFPPPQKVRSSAEALPGQGPPVDPHSELDLSEELPLCQKKNRKAAALTLGSFTAVSRQSTLLVHGRKVLSEVNGGKYLFSIKRQIIGKYGRIKKG